MNIREATDIDSPEIKRLIFSVLEEYGLQPDSSTTDKDLDSICATYGNNGGYFGVAVEDGTIVATVGIYRVNEHRCELRKMYSLPSQRGKGLGKILLEFALLKAKEQGFCRISLETASPLVEAIALYRRYGFKEYVPRHLSDRCDQAFELNL